MALPGTYTVRLVADGQTYTAPITVVRDPRNGASMAAMNAQHTLLMNLDAGMNATWDGAQQANALRAAAEAAAANGSAAVKSAAATFIAQIDSVAGGGTGGRGGPGGGFRRGGAAPLPTFTAVNGGLVRQLEAEDNADMAPTVATLAGWDASCKEIASTVARWSAVTGADLQAFNAVLSQNGARPIPAPTQHLNAPGC